MGESYGVKILKVREIIGVTDITPVPQTPDYVKGVINLRGKVIPIVDLRVKFSLPETDYTEETCIIVVDMDGLLMGVVVDTVSEVLEIKGTEIEPPPSFGAKLNTDYIHGVGKVSGEVKILLNIDKVLSSEELSEVERLADE